MLLPDVEAELPWAAQAFGASPDAINLWIGDQRAATTFHKVGAWLPPHGLVHIVKLMLHANKHVTLNCTRVLCRTITRTSTAWWLAPRCGGASVMRIRLAAWAATLLQGFWSNSKYSIVFKSCTAKA